MIHEFETQLAFKGSRKYLNSSSLIVELCRTIDKELYPKEEWKNIKLDAKFITEVTKNGYFLITKNRQDLLDIQKPLASFKVYDRNVTYFAALIESHETKVTKRMAEPKYDIQELSCLSEFSGSCMISTSPTESYVENVIEANKRIHLLSLKKPNKIINAYMRGFPLVHSNEKTESSLMIQNIGNRSSSGTIATHNALYFNGNENEKFEIGFKSIL